MKEEKKLIGICGTRIFDQNALRFISEIRDYGNKLGYYVITFSANTDSLEDTDDILGEYQLFELSKYLNFSSLVILAETIKNQTLIQQIIRIGREKNIPVFSLDCEIDGCYNLKMNYSNGFEQMVRHVIEEHHAQHINMLAGFKGNPFSEERIAIYKKVLEEYQIPFEENRLGYGDFWDRPSRAAVKKFLKENSPLPDAIICANDSMAITTCSVLKQYGYKVPDDIIVTGFDGIPQGRYHTPILATCDPNYQRCIEFIFDQIEQADSTGQISPSDCDIDFALIESQSCGCKPKVFHDRNQIISTLYENIGDCTWHNLSMNQMVTSLLKINDFMEIAKILPETVKMWSDHFHFVCIKSELLESNESPKNYGEMVTLLRGHHGEFAEPGERFPVTELLPGFHEFIENDKNENVMVVRLLNTGKDVYGYVIEAFYELDDRSLQRCNEFAMFLSHSINSVIHNRQLQELNKNLTEAYNEISQLSLYDPLTNVNNRRGFYQELRSLLSEEENMGKYLYIISIDMDKLKYINDTFGHAEGDFAIVTLAKSIVKVCKSYDNSSICARFGGDEFTCTILSDHLDAYPAETMSQNLNEAIQQMPGVSNKPYPVAASVGLSACQLSADLDIESLIIAADKKMYQNKSERRKARNAENNQ
ncbi:MAG: GGDEF domain-containing protein [Lachnospiraceae bacterium]|nr:GGDEF domain-containing protein [Lachnospiraceae bacterium]